MKSGDINDMIVRVLSNSGVSTDELDGLQDGFISVIRDASRGEILNALALQFKAVAPIFYQEMYFSESDYTKEDECIYLIPSPAPLYKANGTPWVEWIGGADWSSPADFRVAKSRRELVAANNHHIVGRKELVRAFYDTNSEIWWIYSNKNISQFAVRQINARPERSKQYNIDQDLYPFPTDQIDKLMDIIIKRYFRHLQGVQDRVPNSIDDRQAVQQNTRR